MLADWKRRPQNVLRDDVRGVTIIASLFPDIRTYSTTIMHFIDERLFQKYPAALLQKVKQCLAGCSIYQHRKESEIDGIKVKENCVTHCPRCKSEITSPMLTHLLLECDDCQHLYQLWCDNGRSGEGRIILGRYTLVGFTGLIGDLFTENIAI